MNNSKLFKLAALNSLGVLGYVMLVSLVMSNGDKIFGAVDNKVFSPVLFILLFVFSALLTGFLVLGRPIMLYIDGQKKEGVKLLFYTGSCLFVLMLLSMLILIISK